MMRTTAFGLIAFASFAIWSATAVEVVQPPSPVISTSVSECKVCHSDPKSIGLRDYVEKCKSLDFVKLTESVTWEEQDPHSRAFAVLKTPLGKQMSERLKYDVTKAPQCLTCHAIDTQRPGPDRFVGQDSVGIGCTACHGFPKEWQIKHYESPTGTTVPWRTESQEKKAVAGMQNLRDPITKANLCVSCHVGNPEEGTIVTHEMYVAGHPPLPPFELLTYMNDEPRHWGTPFELEFFKSLDSETAKKFSFRPGEGRAGYAARHLAAGAVATVWAEARLLKADSERAMKTQPHAGLDYARFDCYACHHDLKLPSDRQKRGYDGPPGRPPVKAWVGALASVVAANLPGGKDDDFTAKWKAVQQATYARPYADPTMMAKAADDLEKWTDAMKIRFDGEANWSEADVERLHASLREAARSEKWLGDPEAVMVLLWAYRSLHEPLKGSPFADAKLAKVLPVRLRDEFSKNGKPVTIGEIWRERMKRFNAFDSKGFLQLFPGK
jgi:hypothetical protein